jgi:hypothetical protein
MTQPIDSFNDSFRFKRIVKDRPVEQATALGQNAERFGDGRSYAARSKPSSANPESDESPTDERGFGGQAGEQSAEPPESQTDGSIDYLA